MPLLRGLKQRFGIAAPRVAVRAHVPWYWRWFAIVAVGAAAVMAGWEAYDSGMLFPHRAGAPSAALEKLSETVALREREIAEVRARATGAERQLEIERATQGDLAKQVKSLTEENAALKEDLAFFQTLMPAGGRDSALTINRFKLYPEALPGEYRYRLLLVQSGQREREFRGHLQLVVHVAHNEKPLVLTIPAEGEAEAKEYQLRFRFFQRVEGTFRVAPEAVVKSLQIRVYEDGTRSPKLAQTINAS